MKQNNKFPNLILIVANLVPLFGVLFWGWSGKAIIVIYILETVIIGLLNVLKMITVYILNGTKNEPPLPPNPDNTIMVTGWGLIPFFVFHYFFFIFIQSVLFFAFSSMWDKSNPHEPYELINNFLPLINGEARYALIVFAIANGAYLINDFIISGKYATESLVGLMMQPYKRIFVQQFVVILGGFVFMLSGNATIVAIIFIVLKTAADYLSANYNHNSKIKNWFQNKTKNSKKELHSQPDKKMINKMN